MNERQEIKCFPECQCGGEGYIERGPSGATYSYPCYPWDCQVPDCRCKLPEKRELLMALDKASQG